jgi:hypothetical protein
MAFARTVSVWIFWMAVSLVMVAFVSANAGNATVDLWPLPSSLDTPLYLWSFLMAGAGLVVGLTAGRGIRKKRRQEALQPGKESA